MPAVHRSCRAFAVAAFLVFAANIQANAASFNVMTQNMYVGTDASRLLAARDLTGLLAAVGTALDNIASSDPPGRIAAMAGEIAARQPALVGLQEVMFIKTSVPELNWDFLAILLQDLAQLGTPYHAVATFQGLSLRTPRLAPLHAHLIERTVIIARDNGVQLSNPEIGAFDQQLKIQIPFFGTITNTQGGAAVDVEIAGSRFRFVTAHLENLVDGDASIQQAQAADLISRAADTTDLPVIMAADFNANASDPSDPSDQTYKILRRGGSNGPFTDAWKQTNPGDPGFTCCRAPDLKSGNLTERIDLVLYRRGHVLKATAASLAGIAPADRTASGLWPSDHAALEAVFSRRGAAR